MAEVELRPEKGKDNIDPGSFEVEPSDLPGTGGGGDISGGTGDIGGADPFAGSVAGSIPGDIAPIGTQSVSSPESASPGIDASPGSNVSPSSTFQSLTGGLPFESSAGVRTNEPDLGQGYRWIAPGVVHGNMTPGGKHLPAPTYSYFDKGRWIDIPAARSRIPTAAQ